MNETIALKSISDDELLGALTALVERSRRVESELVAHIGEVDRRRLYLREATTSMFAYCTDVLHLSEHEAFMRIGVARASRKHPALLTMLRDGRLHLSAIAKLGPCLDRLDLVGREQLLERAAHKSKRKIEELVAALSPKPDVATSIRKLSERRKTQLGPDRVDASSRSADSLPQERSIQASPRAEFAQPLEKAHLENAHLETVPVGALEVETTTAETTPVPRATMQPLAPERYKVTFTASSDLRERLERLRALMRGRDLALIIEEAVVEKLERVEARRLGKTKTPRKSLDGTDTSSGSRYIPAAVKRIVVERDGDQCSFVNAAGRRCRSRSGLEFHHDEPYAIGGDRSPDNIRLLCRSHNGYLAESTYGTDVMGQYRRNGGLPLARPVKGTTSQARPS